MGRGSECGGCVQDRIISLLDLTYAMKGIILEHVPGIAVLAVDEGFGLGVAVCGDVAPSVNGGFGGSFAQALTPKTPYRCEC